MSVSRRLFPQLLILKFLTYTFQDENVHYDVCSPEGICQIAFVSDFAHADLQQHPVSTQYLEKRAISGPWTPLEGNQACTWTLEELQITVITLDVGRFWVPRKFLNAHLRNVMGQDISKPKVYCKIL